MNLQSDQIEQIRKKAVEIIAQEISILNFNDVKEMPIKKEAVSLFYELIESLFETKEVIPTNDDINSELKKLYKFRNSKE